MLHTCASWLQEAAPGSTFIATMSSQEEVDEWRSKPKTLGGVNEHVYWGYPNDPAEVPLLCVPSLESTHAGHVQSGCAVGLLKLLKRELPSELPWQPCCRGARACMQSAGALQSCSADLPGTADSRSRAPDSAGRDRWAAPAQPGGFACWQHSLLLQGIPAHKTSRRLTPSSHRFDPPAFLQMRAYFERLGWYQTGGETARSCGREVVGPSRQLSFDESVKGTGHSYMFWIAHNVRA